MSERLRTAKRRYKLEKDLMKESDLELTLARLEYLITGYWQVLFEGGSSDDTRLAFHTQLLANQYVILKTLKEVKQQLAELNVKQGA